MINARTSGRDRLFIEEARIKITQQNELDSAHNTGPVQTERRPKNWAFLVLINKDLDWTQNT